MKYIEIILKVKIPFSKDVNIASSLEKDGGKCLLINDNYYQPDIILMKYHPEDKIAEELDLEKGFWQDCGKEFDELIDNKYPVYSESQYKILTEQEIKELGEFPDKQQESSIPEESTKYVILFIDENDSIEKISNAKMNKLLKGNLTLPKYADKKIRMVTALVGTLGKKITDIHQISYSKLAFNNEGKLDKNDMLHYQQIAVDLAFSSPSDNKDKSNIIDAREFFLTKKLENEYSWNPSLDLENAIKLKIFFNK